MRLRRKELTRDMNLLLIGSADSIFIRDYCRNILDNPSVKVTILSQKKPQKYSYDYKELGIAVIEWPRFFQKGLMKQLLHLVQLKREWKELGHQIGENDEIDILHMHFVEPLHLIYFFGLWKKANKKFLTFWGIDIFEISRTKSFLLSFFLKQTDNIVFMILKQKEFFCKIYGHKYDSKIRIIDFGNSQIDIIDKVSSKYTVEKCKEHFKLPLDKYIVHVGYNACKEQQHLAIVKNVANLSQEYLKKMKFVFHMSYGYSDDYIAYKQQLQETMYTYRMDYSIIEDYLQGEDLAMFRRTCNIFLYGQKTDARSASPLEYVYSGAIFICPEWLSENYKLFDEGNIKYYVYNQFEDLNRVLEQSIRKLEKSEEIISPFGRKKIQEKKSWKSLSKEWRSLYE